MKEKPCQYCGEKLIPVSVCSQCGVQCEPDLTLAFIVMSISFVLGALAGLSL